MGTRPDGDRHGVCERLARDTARARQRLNERIARLAYAIAERRGFAPGHELEDWLAAEAQLAAGRDDNDRRSP